MQMVIDEPNICNQTGRVYFCINGNESSVCHVRLYNTPHSDDGIIALFEEKTTLYLGSDGLVNRLYVIRRYFSKRLVFHSRNYLCGSCLPPADYGYYVDHVSVELIPVRVDGILILFQKCYIGDLNTVEHLV